MSPLLSQLTSASLQGAIALLVVGVLCFCLRRFPATLRCWLWRLGLLKCLAGLFLTLSIALPLLSPPKPISALPKPYLSDPKLISSNSKTQTSNSKTQTSNSKTQTSNSKTQPSEFKTQPSEFKTQRSTLPLASSLYILGLSVVLTRFVIAGTRTLGLVRRAEAVQSDVLDALAPRFGLRCAPRLARSAEITSPLLAFGTILLPKESTDDEALVLAHELAHAQRHDLAWELLGTLIQALFWFHPLVWWAKREESLAREQATDALALAVTGTAPADYGRLLLAATLQRRPQPLTVGLFESPSRLRRRLEALAQPTLPHHKLLALGSFALLIALAAFIPWRAVARQEATKPAPQPQIHHPLPAGKAVQQHGRVFAIEGAPIAHATVSWVRDYTDMPEVYSQTTTDANGAFTLKVFQERDYKFLNGWILVEANGYGRAFLRHKALTPELQIGLKAPTTKVYAFQDKDGKPITGLRAWAKELHNISLHGLGYEGTTDAKGEFALPNLSAEDAPLVEFDRTDWVLDTTSFSQNTQTFTLTPSHTLEGVITNPDGSPADRVEIALNGSGATRSVWGHDRTDEKGHYQITGLTAGNYHLLTKDASSDTTLILPNPTNFVVSSNRKTTTLNLRLVPAALLIGTISDTKGRPVLASLHVADCYTRSEKDGHYALSVPAGTATLTLGGVGYKTVTLSPKETRLVDLTVPY